MTNTENVKIQVVADKHADRVKVMDIAWDHSLPMMPTELEFDAGLDGSFGFELEVWFVVLDEVTDALTLAGLPWARV